MQPLEVDGVSKVFRTGSKFELEPLSFAVGAGEVVSVLGVNGAGKSTLLRIIAGTVAPDRGEVRVNGSVVGRHRGCPRFSVVLEGGRSLYWKMTARENVEYFSALKGVPPAARRERRDRAIAMAGLEHCGDSLVATLSRGMQQRLVIAIAMLNEPSVLLLDEPTIGVDFVHEQKIIEQLKALQANGCAVVLTSHQLDVVEKVADRALLLDCGRLVEHRRISELHALFGRQHYQLELDAPPPAEMCARLIELGANIEQCRVRLAAGPGEIYRLLDAVRPARIVACQTQGGDLKSLMETYTMRHAA